MKKKDILWLCLCTLCISACEKVIDIDSKELRDGKNIVLSAIIDPDTVITARVAQSYYFTDLPALTYDYYTYYDDPWRDETAQKAVTKDARVELIVNGSESHPMSYDTVSCSYVSSYRPMTTDHITIRVEDNEKEVATATTTIPEQQCIEILSAEKVYNKKPTGQSSVDMTGTDTLIILTLKITDPGKEKNFYRLKVRNCIHGAGNTLSTYSDIYSSSDPLFHNRELKKNWGGWPAYFSNIFDDSLFDGMEYEFVVESRMRRGKNGHIELELQSLSEDFYNYLKAVMLYRITDLDDYTESIYIPGNVQNGWGILGAVHSDKHILPWGECEVVEE